MPRKSIHWRAVRDYPSFPNNRRSTRFPRRKVATKRVWKGEESPAYFGVPDTALFTPWDLPNPTDRMPGLKNYHTIHYSDAGGYAPAPAFRGLGLQAYANSSREIWGGLSPTSPDTDGDGMQDGEEVAGIGTYASVDVSDKIGTDNSVSVFFDMWQADAGFWDLDDDTPLSLDKTVSHNVMVNGKAGHTTGYYKGTGHHWGAVWYDIDTVYLEKDKTTLIVPKDGSKTYTAPATGELRYTGEQRFFVFLLAVDDSYVETVIVPESIYYDSKLGDILQRGEDAKNEIPSDLRGIEFSSPDESQQSLSIAIRGMHAATVTKSQVTTIINYLCVNKTGQRVYESIDITKNVFSVGLADDVLELIPIVPPKISELGRINEGFLASFAAAIGDIAGFIWNGICAVGNFLLSVATFVVSLGLAVLGEIWDAICELATILVKFLEMLLDFIIGMIKMMVEIVFRPLIDVMEDWLEKMANTLNELFEEGVEQLTDVGEKLYTVMTSHIFWALLITVGAAIGAAIILLTGFQFVPGVGQIGTIVATLVISFIVSMVVAELTGLVSNLFEDLVHFVIPKDDPFWLIGPALIILDLIISLSIYIYGKYALKIKSDVWGLVLSFASLFLLLVGDMLPLHAVYVNMISLFLSFLGLGWTLLPDEMDEHLPGPFKYIEELIAGACLGIDYYEFAKSVGDL